MNEPQRFEQKFYPGRPSLCEYGEESVFFLKKKKKIHIIDENTMGGWENLLDVNIMAIFAI